MRCAEAAWEDLTRAAAAAAKAMEEENAVWERIEKCSRALAQARSFTHPGPVPAFAEAWLPHWREAARALREFAGVHSLDGVPLPQNQGYVVARDVFDELLQDPDRDDGLQQRFVRYVSDLMDAAERLGTAATCDPLRMLFGLLHAHFVAPAITSLRSAAVPLTPTKQPVAAGREPRGPVEHSPDVVPTGKAAVGAFDLIVLDHSTPPPAQRPPRTRNPVLKPGEITASDAVRKYGIPRATLRDAQSRGELWHRRDEFANVVIYSIDEVARKAALRSPRT